MRASSKDAAADSLIHGALHSLRRIVMRSGLVASALTGPLRPKRGLALTFVVLGALSALPLAAFGPGAMHGLSLDERIACQTAVEEVYFSTASGPETSPVLSRHSPNPSKALLDADVLDGVNLETAKWRGVRQLLPDRETSHRTRAIVYDYGAAKIAVSPTLDIASSPSISTQPTVTVLGCSFAAQSGR
jgi:hypothetical protein